MFAPTMRDWSKVKAYRNGVWPKPLPPGRLFGLDQGLPDAPFVAIDTEYHAPVGVAWDDPGFRRQDAILDLVGVGWPSPDGDVVVQCPWALGTSDAGGLLQADGSAGW